MNGIENAIALSRFIQSILCRKYPEINFEKANKIIPQIVPRPTEKKVQWMAFLILSASFFKKAVLFDSVISIPEMEIAWQSAITGNVS